jgi:hypothetical protein
MAMSSAEASYNKTEKLANDIELVKIDYDKISTKLDENIGYAEGYANEAKSAVEDIRLALEDFREENKNPELSLLNTEIE